MLSNYFNFQIIFAGFSFKYYFKGTNTDTVLMCIFDGPIRSVANTKILIAPVYPAKLVTKQVNGSKRVYKQPSGRPLQLVIYSNNVTKQESALASDLGEEGVSRPTAMILPFPLIKGTNRVKILDMSRYPNFFDDLDLLFPQELEGSRSFTNSYSDSDNEPLPVQYVGGYKASIVPNFKNFDRLQYHEFNLSPDVKELLATYYSSGFGFMVCILTRSSTQYHPFAYVHEIREDRKLFVPTRHYHRKTSANPFAKYHDPTEGRPPVEDAEDMDGGEIADYFYRTLALEDRWIELTAKKQNLESTRTSPRKQSEVDWDHEIYVLNCPRITRSALLNKPGIRIIPASNERLGNMYVYVNSQFMPNDIALGEIRALHKIKIDPVFRNNCDLFL